MPVIDAVADAMAEAVQHHGHGGHGRIHPKPHVVEAVTASGVRTLTLVCIIMAVGFCVFVGSTIARKGSDRAHGFCAFFITGMAALSYFAMATQEGAIIIHVGHGMRQVFYARYIDWFVTTPLLLLDVLLLSGCSIGDLLWIIAADVLMIITGLISALVIHGQWVWFVIGCIAMLAVFYGLFVPGRKCAYARSNETGGLYMGLVTFLLVLWTCYPIVFALAEGTGKISSNKEVMLYGILDVLAKVVFGAIIIAKAPDHGHGTSLLETSINAPLLGHSSEIGDSIADPL